MDFFMVLVLIMVSYEASRIFYPNMELVARKQTVTLKESPQIEISTAKDGTTAVCPGQILTLEGVPVAKVPLSQEYRTYTIISMIYSIILLVAMFNNNVYCVGGMAIFILSHFITKQEPSANLLRLDAVASLCIYIGMLAFG